MLHYNIVVCNTPNLIELCYYLAYKNILAYSSIIGYGMVCLYNVFAQHVYNCAKKLDG